MKIQTVIITHKPTGTRFVMVKKLSWGIVYYSADSGRTWHQKKSDAYDIAFKTGTLTIVKPESST